MMRFFAVKEVYTQPPEGSIGAWLQAKLPSLYEERNLLAEYAALPIVPEELFNRCVDAAVDAAISGEMETLNHSDLGGSHDPEY